MEVYIRKVIKGSKNKNSYTVNLPLEIVEKYQLQNSNVIITDNGENITISKNDQIVKSTIKKSNISDGKILV